MAQNEKSHYQRYYRYEISPCVECLSPKVNDESFRTSKLIEANNRKFLAEFHRIKYPKKFPVVSS